MSTDSSLRVGLFVTCLIDMMRPSIGMSALKLLELAGCDVHVPNRQTCCGQPGWNSGDRSSAAALARKMIGEFEDCSYIVAPSGSCIGMVKQYPQVLAGDPQWQARARAAADKAYELSDFLLNIARIPAVPGHFDGVVAYHDSCAGLRELGIRQQPRTLLERVTGLRLVPLPDAEVCCGFGGTFSIKFGDISAAMAENKCRNIRASGADAVVLGDLGCMLNIEGRLRKEGDTRTRVFHFAEILAGQAGG